MVVVRVKLYLHRGRRALKTAHRANPGLPHNASGAQNARMNIMNIKMYLKDGGAHTADLRNDC